MMKKTIMLLLCSFTMFAQNLKSLGEEFQRQEKEQKEIIEKSPFLRNYVIDSVVYELHHIENNVPIYYKTFNVDAAKSTRVNHLNTGGSLGLNLNGQGITYYVWDSGHALSTHQEFVGRVSIEDGSELTSYHGTHVVGTIIASGVNPLAKGMAYQGLVRSYNWGSDLSEATFAASNGMLLSNHSYGFSPSSVPDYYFGAYITNSRNWDNLMYNAPYYLMCVAAGNDGMTNFNESPLNPNFPQYDKLTGHATSKNGLTVAAAEDAVINAQGDLVSVSISNFSSQGPTDDLRIKPDITGNGRGVFSTYNSNNTSYGTLSGTSMATPNVVGSLGLLQQHYKNINSFYMRAATLKGIALHTADDAGAVGPDAIFGWGLLNAKRAAQTITDNNIFSRVNELTLSQGDSYTITVSSDNFSTLRASISWTDPAGVVNTGVMNEPTPKLINDLDLRVTKNGVTYFPWKMISVTTNTKADNNVDPFERVDVDNASGEYVITVTHKGTLLNGNQKFSLVVTGISDTGVACNLLVPSGINIASVTETTVNVGWNFIPGASYEIRYRKINNSVWDSLPISNPYVILTGLEFNTNYELQLRTVCGNDTTDWTSSFLFSTLKECLATTPQNINILNVTGVSATLTWTAIEFAEYDIFYKPITQQFGVQVSTSNNSRLLAGLQPSTTYEIKIRSKCLFNGTFSEWSETQFFTTLDVCTVLPPSSITISDISTSSASISWTPVTGAVKYRLRWKPLSTNTYSVTETTNLNRTLTDLLSGTNYLVEVQSICDTGSPSNYSQSYFFTTLTGNCVPTTVSNLEVSGITNTYAYLSWSGVNPTYLVRWKKVGSIVTSSTIISQPFLNMFNLQEASTYDVEVLGRCENGNTSTAVTLSFTTGGVVIPPPPVCNPTTPTGITNGGGGLITWNEVELATYDVQYTLTQGKANWITLSTPNNFIQLPFQQGLKYKVQVRSRCGTQVSSWGNININSFNQQSKSYPNPVTDFLNVETEGYIRLFNSLGVLVFEGEYQQTIDMSRYPSGIYLLKIDDNIEKIVKK